MVVGLTRLLMPYQREAEIVLAMWREVEHDLDIVLQESPEIERLQGEAHRLKAEYRRLTDLARENHRPVPPAMTRG